MLRFVLRGSSRRLLVAALAVVGVLVAGSSVLASGGRIPIHELPFTITEPGSYYLTRNLSHLETGAAIKIEASGVTIDLMGHEIRASQDSLAVVYMSGSYRGVVIRNGIVAGGRNTVYLHSTVTSGFSATVESLQISESMFTGLRIRYDGDPGQSHSLVRNNQIFSSGSSAIFLQGISGGRVTGNAIQMAGSAGIYIKDSEGITVAHNTVSRSDSDGMSAFTSHRILYENNHISGGARYGFYLSADCTGCIYSRNRSVGNSSGNYGMGTANFHDAGDNVPAI